MTTGSRVIGALSAAFFILLAGCNAGVDSRATIMTDESSDRFQVVRVATFTDRLAQYNERGVYVVNDRLTGKQFVGIDGVGLAETSRSAENR